MPHTDPAHLSLLDLPSQLAIKEMSLSIILEVAVFLNRSEIICSPTIPTFLWRCKNRGFFLNHVLVWSLDNTVILCPYAHLLCYFLDMRKNKTYNLKRTMYFSKSCFIEVLWPAIQPERHFYRNVVAVCFIC